MDQKVGAQGSHQKDRQERSRYKQASPPPPQAPLPPLVGAPPMSRGLSEELQRLLKQER